jgi:Fe-S cluster assembly ATP-binding protein
MPTSNNLTIKNLTINSNEKTLIDNFSLALKGGTIHALIGPNGAGKSTIAAALMGLDGYRDIKGEIKFRGKLINALSVNDRANLGITLGWQEPARFEGVLIRKYLEISAKTQELSKLEKALDEVGLEPCDYLERALDKTLSGGERKRIEIASLILMKPGLAIFDEPDSGVDSETIKKVARAIQNLKRAGSSVILITHNPDILKEADTASLICSGKMINEGPAIEMQKQYKVKCVECAHKNEPKGE